MLLTGLQLLYLPWKKSRTWQQSSRLVQLWTSLFQSSRPAGPRLCTVCMISSPPYGRPLGAELETLNCFECDVFLCLCFVIDCQRVRSVNCYGAWWATKQDLSLPFTSLSFRVKNKTDAWMSFMKLIFYRFRTHTGNYFSIYSCWLCWIWLIANKNTKF